MDQKLKRKWVEALRSGEYEQGQGALVTFGKRHDHFCCLGVLLDLMGAEWDEDLIEPNHGIAFVNGRENEHAGLIDDEFGILDIPTQTVFAALNDNGVAFDKIADHIEETL